MAIERSPYYGVPGLPLMEEEGEGLTVEVVNPDALALETEDGGLVIDFTNGEIIDPTQTEHGDNLAKVIPEDELTTIGNELLSQFRADRSSRKEWETAYKKGLDLLGLKEEEKSEPWDGACGVFHPMLTESVVRFQSHAIMETFPADGPVKAKICGKSTRELEQAALRIKNDMNYIVTEQMTEYRNEHERLLFNLPLCGSAFKKIWYDPILRRPKADFVAADDFVVSYGATELQSCPRYTHVMRLPENEVKKLMAAGLYRQVKLSAPEPDFSDVQKKHDELMGQEASVEHDDRHQILEMHVDIDLPEPFADPDGIARPHVVTITSSGKVLSIYRNYREDDETYGKQMWFSHYYYLPGLGFYGIGLIHLIGGLTKSATSVLRQLVDSGTLANLPGGFKAKGFRVKGEDTPIGPGEWRDVDVPGDNIKNALLPLPYKEPSAVLYQLLGTITDEGRRIGSIADVDISDTSKETPVGTTLALMERSLKVISAVQARLFASMRVELRILKRIIRDNMDEEYSISVEEGATRYEDYSSSVDVVPVANPNASTMAQKVVQYQAAIQMSQSAPHAYNVAELHRGMVEVLEIKNPEKVVPIEEDLHPMDPVAENMAIVRQEPVKAFLYQDHDAHIATHMAATQDPNLTQLIGQSPMASAIQSAMMAHIAEHVAYKHRRDVERHLGTPMPDPEEKLPRDVEYQMSRLVAEAAQRATAESQQNFQQQENQKKLEDPVIQLQMREQEVKEREQDLKEREQEFEQWFKIAELQTELYRDGAKIGADLAKESAELSVDSRKTGFKLATDFIAKLEQMNMQRENNAARPSSASDRADTKGNRGPQGQGG